MATHAYTAAQEGFRNRAQGISAGDNSIKSPFGKIVNQLPKFFHACLERGVYFAPSQFETGFVSTAHTPNDVERTANVVRQALHSK